MKGSLPDLTLPRVGSTTMRGLCSRYLKRQTKFSRMLTWETLIEAEHGMVQRLRAVFDQVLEREPGIFFSLLRLPSIGGLLRCVENALRQRDQRAASHYATEVFTQLALELWHLDQFEQEVRLPVGRRILISEVGGWWDDVPGGLDSLIIKPDGLFYGARESQRIEPVTTERAWASEIRDGIKLAHVDVNPLALNEAHPDKAGNTVDFGDRATEDWVSSLEQALGLVESTLPDLYEEMKVVLRTIVPVGVDEHAHLSASYQEVIGAIYVSLHPNPMTMAEALIHEFSHTKLNTLANFDPVLVNAFAPLFPSPYRPDPRPLHGILLGVHAFLPVERFYERLVEQGHIESSSRSFVQRRRDLREKNRTASETLILHGEPTDLGAELLHEIERLNAEFAERLS